VTCSREHVNHPYSGHRRRRSSFHAPLRCGAPEIPALSAGEKNLLIGWLFASSFVPFFCDDLVQSARLSCRGKNPEGEPPAFTFARPCVRVRSLAPLLLCSRSLTGKRARSQSGGLLAWKDGWKWSITSRPWGATASARRFRRNERPSPLSDWRV